MKTKLQKLITVMALFAFAFIAQSQTVINTVYEDANIVNDGTTSTVQAWVADSFVGPGAVGTNNCTVIPFQLPNDMGSPILDVSFESLLTKIDAWVGGRVDMYAIDARASGTVLGSDYYLGDYDADSNPAVTAIAQGYMETTTALGKVSTNASANAALKTFIESQYALGKENEYIFIRLSPSAEWTNYQRYWITGYDNITSPNGNEPKLTITFDTTASVKDENKQSLSLYPNPVTNGRLKISLDGFSNEATIDIYSITGQLVHSEKIDASSRNSFDTQLNLKAGLYIVKLQDGQRGATQKLIVQ